MVRVVPSGRRSGPAAAYHGEDMAEVSRDDQAAAEGRAPLRVALIVAMAWFMQNLDTTIINTSLPQMAETFGVDAVSVNIGITAYVVAGAAFIPLGGWLSDRYGAKRIFAIAIVVFGLASIACAACTALWQFVLARVVQGAGGALMVPVGRIIVLKNAGKQDLMRATALITWPALLAPVIAPVLGGALTTWYGWEWIFLLNAPLALAGTVLVLAYVPSVRDSEPKPLDRVGTVLIVTSLSLTIYGLSELAQPSLIGLDLALPAVGLLVGVGAVRWFRRAAYPLVGLGPLRVPTFAAASLHAGNLIRLAISATPFLLPLMLQEAWGLTPLEAGQLVLVYFLGNLVIKVITTPLMRWLGFRTVLVCNGIGVGLSIAAFGLLDARTGFVVGAAVAFVAGATRSIEFTGINTLSFADIGSADRASASTLFSMTQQISVALGVAVAAIALQVAHGPAATPLTQSDFSLAFYVSGAIALAGALLMLLLRPDAGHEVTGHRPRRDARTNA
ncbi:MFS transporter [Nonomuraea sp. NPDC049504]|uniref:MFS transporter n=1 Tax=Nonomuraea sp. NPDC049504 TaxID=3154729 RepID=UPI00342AD77A